jgi:two-component system nitrogen regulation sensor histidine kinase GlnL
MAQQGGSLTLLRTAQAVAPDAVAVLAALPSAMLLIDPAGTVAQVNAAAEALLNTSEGHLVGQPLGRLVSLPAYVDRQGDAPIAAYDIDVPTPKGVLTRVDVASTPFAGHAGWRLITLHGATAAQRMSHDRARSTTRTAYNMAQMLAHEIKNPLSGIRGAAQLLEGQVDDESGLRMTRLIRDEVDRIAALIDQMQGFTDTRTLERTPENIYAILDHVRDLAGNGFARGVEMRDAFDPSLPPVLVHRDSLVQVLLNLLKNAAEAVDKTTGYIKLTTAYRHGVSVSVSGGARRLALPIELCVIDSGAGPPQHITENLFEPFVTSKSSGRGLGLALADKLMRDMGGLIQFAREGVPEQTVFRLLLPRAGAKK